MTGWPLVRTILLTTIPAAVVLLVYAVVSANASDAGGRVPIPGERVVELEQGRVSLAYEEARNLEEGSGTPIVDDADFLEIPRDLEVTVRPRGEQEELPLDETSFGSVVEDGDGVRKVFAKVDVPADGSYTVVTRPIDRTAPDPAVTIGPDALSAFTPWGLGALAAALIGAVVAGAWALAGRRRRAAA